MLFCDFLVLEVGETAVQLVITHPQRKDEIVDKREIVVLIFVPALGGFLERGVEIILEFVDSTSSLFLHRSLIIRDNSL